MAESIAIEPHHGRHRAVGVDAPSAAFEPKPPEPLLVSRDEPPAPVSRPPLRASRTKRLWPLVIGSMVVASALAVGHHWYQRQHMALHQPTPSAPLPTAEAPFSLHAAWREVERRQASAQTLGRPKETPVVSVLDDPVDAQAAEPGVNAPPAGEPSPAALLADRMAAAAAPDAATASAPALVADEKEVSAPVQPAETPAAVPPPASTSAGHVLAPAPATVATGRHRTPPAAKPERAPGMTGLGGPPAAAGSRAAPEQPRRTTPLSSAPRTASRSGGPAALGGPHPRPRKPYRRSPAVAAPAAQAAEFPPRDPTIFKRIERTMP